MKLILNVFAITLLVTGLSSCYTAAVAGAGAGAGYIIADKADKD